MKEVVSWHWEQHLQKHREVKCPAKVSGATVVGEIAEHL